MLDPPPRRKPATEVELKISAGDVSAVGDLVDLLDSPLHRHLAAEFPTMLSEGDREDIIAEFIADLVEKPTKYNHSKGSIQTFSKVCVRRKAIDLLRRRDTQKQYELGPGTAAVLKITSSDPADDVELAIQIERAKVAAEGMDPKYRAALRAYREHGRDGYKAALSEEFGITGDAAAQWLARAKKVLAQATGLGDRLSD